MKGRLLTSLFALPFAGVGLWMSWSIGAMFVDATAMRDWQPVEASVETGGYHVHSGDSTTYEAYATYQYAVAGNHYRGTRVAIESGADNIGNFQRSLGDRLEAAARRGSTITVYVDPQSPQDAIVDRRVRWGLVGFKALFMLVFGGVGCGLLYYQWRKSRQPVTHATNDAPWFANGDWQSATIRSGSRAGMWFAWAFATFWCLVSSPMPFLAWQEISAKDNWVALVALLFPLIGLGLIAWAVRRSREWRRFGPAPLTLDPFPGSIGGHVGGTIDLRLPFDPSVDFTVTLANLKSYVSGSGKNRSRRETAEWQDTRVAHGEGHLRGTRLVFRFDVPEGLNEADATRANDSYYLWRLNVRATLPGADLDRDYDLPVYRTAMSSQALPQRAIEAAGRKQAGVHRLNLQKRFRFEQAATGKRLYFRAGRNLGAGLAGTTIGLVFAAMGYFFFQEGVGLLFAVAFTGVGGLIALACLYMIANTLDVRQEGSLIISQRGLLGLPIRRRELRRRDIVRLEKDDNLKTQSGGRHVVHYVINALGRNGESAVLGEGFRGSGEADAAMQFIAKEFNLDLPASQATTDDATGNVLAAD